MINGFKDFKKSVSSGESDVGFGVDCFEGQGHEGHACFGGGAEDTTKAPPAVREFGEVFLPEFETPVFGYGAKCFA